MQSIIYLLDEFARPRYLTKDDEALIRHEARMLREKINKIPFGDPLRYDYSDRLERSLAHHLDNIFTPEQPGADLRYRGITITPSDEEAGLPPVQHVVPKKPTKIKLCQALVLIMSGMLVTSALITVIIRNQFSRN